MSEDLIRLGGRARWLRTVLVHYGAVLTPRDRDVLTAVTLTPGQSRCWYADHASLPGITGPLILARIDQLIESGLLCARTVHQVEVVDINIELLSETSRPS